jgi:hypothetical protein
LSIITRTFDSWESGSIFYRFDDTVLAGFPVGQWTAIGWNNQNATRSPSALLTLTPGRSTADLSGTITSIPMGSGLNAPIPTGTAVLIGGQQFTTTAGRQVGALAVPVSSQAVQGTILSGADMYVPLPSCPIPVPGDVVTLPAFWQQVSGATTIDNQGVLNITSRNIPMLAVTIKGGGTNPQPPATLGIAG